MSLRLVFVLLTLAVGCMLVNWKEVIATRRFKGAVFIIYFWWILFPIALIFKPEAVLKKKK